VRLWVKPGFPSQQAKGRVTGPEELEEEVRRLYAVASEKCPHTHADYTQKMGDCCNEYRCRNCGTLFLIDSSG